MPSPENFIEIDFLAVETARSGDAIAIRYSIEGQQTVHVVDGGFTAMGEKIGAHIDAHYNCQGVIDHVVLTHPDGDHALGLKYILENYEVKNLWMNRPWLYADRLIQYFDNYESVPHLERRLKKVYCHTAALEELAEEKGIPIWEAFQGSDIGIFRVMAPTFEHYLNLVLESERTPDATPELSFFEAAAATATKFLRKAANLVKAVWGEEYFPDDPTSRENEMSLVQFAIFDGTSFMLTGDAGRETLAEVLEYGPLVGVAFPGVDRFQVPHHGSRHNVSSQLLDDLLGAKVAEGSATSFDAFVSSAKDDPDHPRKSVIRAVYHRGGQVYCTEGVSLRTGLNTQPRAGWSSATPASYPTEQED